MAKPKKRKIIYVELDDHCTGNYKWENSQETKHCVWPIFTVGFLIKEDKKYLTLALMTSPFLDTCSDTFTIVKSCITKRKVLHA